MTKIDNVKYVKNPTTVHGIKVVNNIEQAVEELKKGHTIARFEFGDSMMPILKNGEYGIATPIQNLNEVSVGDAVVCEVNGHLMTHMVVLISESHAETPYFLIGSTWMNFYGWTNKIYGIVKGTNVCQEPINFDETEPIE